MSGSSKRVRTVPAAALVTALATALAACGGVSAGGDDEGDGAATSLTTMGFGLGDEIATARVDAYTQESGVEVEVNEGGFDEQQFLSAIASGSPPDAVRMDRSSLGTYAARGALMPLEDCIATADVDMAAFRDPAVEQVTLDGTVWGLPEFYSVRVVIADESSLQAAGLTPEAVSTGDWEALVAADARLSAAEGGNVSRIGYDAKLADFFPMWVAAAGGQVLSDDGRTAMLDTPEAVAAVELGARLAEQQGGWPSVKAFKETWDFFGAENQFAIDQLGAMPMEDWYVNQLAEVADGPVGVTVLPFKDVQGQPLTWATGSAWAIPAESANPDEACEFIATMTAADTWVTAARARAQALRDEGGAYTGTYTGNEVADEQIFSEVYEPTGDPSLDAAVQTLQDVQGAAFSLPASPAGAEFTQAYTDAITRVLEGQQPAAEAMAQAQEEAQAALDEAGGDS